MSKMFIFIVEDVLSDSIEKVFSTISEITLSQIGNILESGNENIAHSFMEKPKVEVFCISKEEVKLILSSGIEMQTYFDNFYATRILFDLDISKLEAILEKNSFY